MLVVEYGVFSRIVLNGWLFYYVVGLFVLLVCICVYLLMLVCVKVLLMCLSWCGLMFSVSRCRLGLCLSRWVDLLFGVV